MNLSAEPRASGAAIDSAGIRERLGRLPGVKRFLVALSGGLDSCVLLHLLTRSRPAAALRAVHVNHNLRPAAGEWQDFCAQLCASSGIAIDILKVDARAARGESPEAAAREARYAAIREIMQPGDCLLTAHQRDDQAETLLLQLLRGSGPAGLAAMPELTSLGPGWQFRPLLNSDRSALHRYAVDSGLRWIEDDSNADSRYDRNFLRREVMPLLRTRWPALSRTLARVALHQAEALGLMQAMAELDLPGVRNPSKETLAVSRLRMLPPSRLHNVLRYWCGLREALPPSMAVLRQIAGCIEARSDSSPRVAWGNWEVRRHNDDLYLLDRNMPPLQRQYAWSLHAGEFCIPELRLRLRLPDLQAAGLHVPAAADTLFIRFREGGERIRLPGRRHSHSLKNILQDRGVPPWQRARLPLLYDGEGRLLAVLGLEPPVFAATDQRKP